MFTWKKDPFGTREQAKIQDHPRGNAQTCTEAAWSSDPRQTEFPPLPCSALQEGSNQAVLHFTLNEAIAANDSARQRMTAHEA